jgi:hypothetical protein
MRVGGYKNKLTFTTSGAAPRSWSAVVHQRHGRKATGRYRFCWRFIFFWTAPGEFFHELL